MLRSKENKSLSKSNVILTDKFVTLIIYRMEKIDVLVLKMYDCSNAFTLSFCGVQVCFNCIMNPSLP